MRTPAQKLNYVCRLFNLLSTIPIMLEALQKIAEMEPEEHEEDLGTSGSHIYTTDCHTCGKMIATAREALEKVKAKI